METVPPENKRFAALYDAHAARVYGWCLRLCGGCRPDAEDLTQETFLAAFGSLPGFQSRAKTTTWLYQIALRRFWTWRNEKSRLPLLAPPSGTASPYADLAADFDLAHSSLRRLGLHAALASLSPPLREAFLLVKAEGLTHKEAARVLGVPTGTVQSRVHEATHKLRVLLRDEDANETPLSIGNQNHAL